MSWADASFALALIFSWFGGVALAPAGWPTIGAFLFPPYAWTLMAGRVLAALGLM